MKVNDNESRERETNECNDVASGFRQERNVGEERGQRRALDKRVVDAVLRDVLAFLLR